MIQSVYENCVICMAMEKVPKEISLSTPNTVPQHPGQFFTIDVIRKAKKKALVSVDNHSGFIMAQIVMILNNQSLK